MSFLLSIGSGAHAEALNGYDILIDAYRNCLFPAAVEFAQKSSEPAETIKQAALAHCYKQRDRLTSAAKGIGVTDDELREFDVFVDGQLALAILKTRSPNSN